MPFDGTPPLTELQHTMLRAVKIIEQRGWCQDAFEHDDGRVCAMGAIAFAVSDDSNRPFTEPEAALYRASYEAFTARVGNLSVAAWNDAGGRTKDEVVAMLRKVAGA